MPLIRTLLLTLFCSLATQASCKGSKFIEAVEGAAKKKSHSNRNESFDHQSGYAAGK